LIKPSYVLILDAHPVEDGRIQKHIRFLQSSRYTVYHIHFIPYKTDKWVDDGEYSLFGEKSWHFNLHWKIRHKGLRLLNYLSLFSPALSRKTIDVIQSLNINSIESGIIHVHDPILLPLAKQIQKRFLKSGKIVYDRHEVYEDMKRFAGIGGYRIFEQVSGNSISGIVVVSERHKDSVSRLYPGVLLSTVPNFPMNAFVDEKTILDKIDSFSHSTPVTCIYIGSLRKEFDRDIDLLFSLIEVILTEIPTTRFILGGSCEDDIMLSEINVFRQKFSHRFNYLGSIPYDQVIRKTENAHIGFYFMKPNSNYWVPCSPNKIYEYLSCGVVPVIRADCDHQDKIKACGLVFSQSASEKQVIDNLISLIKDSTRMKTLMKQSLAIGSELTYESAALDYCKLYDNIIKNI